jgi:hypothetical protein
MAQMKFNASNVADRRAPFDPPHRDGTSFALSCSFLPAGRAKKVDAEEAPTNMDEREPESTRLVGPIVAAGLFAGGLVPYR